MTPRFLVVVLTALVEPADRARGLKAWRTQATSSAESAGLVK
ncbi:MAG TPA: hypothetical protein VHR45_25745 [Thermoanaerobaculia bacterium]|nr:hypothetical protein [Thermoanaerobaculia bacterium]